MAIFTNEEKALTQLKRLIEQAELEIQHLEKSKKIDAANLLITVGKILIISARLDDVFMNDKKWYENIPDGGVLVNWLDSIIRIMSYDEDGCIDDKGDCYDISDMNFMRSLTSAEIIEFLPESEQCRESCVSDLVNYSDDELIDGRLLCKECAL